MLRRLQLTGMRAVVRSPPGRERCRDVPMHPVAIAPEDEIERSDVPARRLPLAGSPQCK